LKLKFAYVNLYTPVDKHKMVIRAHTLGLVLSRIFAYAIASSAYGSSPSLNKLSPRYIHDVVLTLSLQHLKNTVFASFHAFLFA
jgi:hypothetical protein